MGAVEQMCEALNANGIKGFGVFRRAKAVFVPFMAGSNSEVVNTAMLRKVEVLAETIAKRTGMRCTITPRGRIKVQFA